MHLDPELLGLLALGEEVGTEDERHHAQTCPECAEELAELRRVVTLGRSVSADTMMATPSQDVWGRIRDELGIEPAGSGITGALAARSGDEVTVQARLASIDPSWSRASGTAEVSTDERGRRLLQVVLRADLPASGLRQAWLIHRADPSVRQTLGILDGLHGLWTIEHSIDLSEYSILDISQQGTGETEHSGHTIVRGELTRAS